MSDKGRILLVEDDINLGFVIQDNLKIAGYHVHLATDGKQGLKAFNEEKYDLGLFDVMLPKKDGFSLAEDIRRLNQTMPIIFLTAKSMVEDKIKGFKVGADDYVTKPFSIEELSLRIEAILKRSSGNKIADYENYSIGSYTFDISTYELQHKDLTKKLTKKEAEILKLLCQHPEKVIEREVILNLVWGDDSYFNGRSLDVFITKLRKYLKEDPSVKITNVHGIGFKLETAKD